MLLKDVFQIIECKVLSNCAWENVEIQGGCGADLMSDVLAAVQPHALLLTGLCNPQVVRTAQMADVAAIVFVRGKVPAQDVVNLANNECVPLITAPYGMFELCG